MTIYYVYAYLRKDGTPYYVGKGKGNRAYDKNHSVSVPRDRSRIVFLETHLTNIGACAIERRMIMWYGRKDIGTGILHNRTEGGEGSPGFKHTEEWKHMMSQRNKGRKMPASDNVRKAQVQTGRTVPDHVRRKISNTLTGRKLTQEHIDKVRAAKTGVKRSAEYCERLSLQRRGANSTSAILIHIYDDSGTLQYVCHGNFKNTCIANQLPFDALTKSYNTDGAPLYQTKKPPKQYIQYRGWFAIRQPTS